MIRINSLSPLFLLVFLACFVGNLAADENFFSQDRTVKLLDAKGVPVDAASLQFSPTASGEYRFELTMHYEDFSDYFLSMKEMKCLEGRELWCHIPYPHNTPTTVSSNDLRWLEHALIFMFKDKKSFGANFWNGVYYKLEWANGMLAGEAQHLDLNMLASPPEDSDAPPVGEYDIEPMDAEKRWLTRVVIE